MNFGNLDSIKNRLILGFAIIIGLLAFAGIVGTVTINNFSAEIAGTLGTVRRETSLTASLNTSVAQELSAAARYLDRGAAVDLEAFRSFGWEAHSAQRQLLNSSTGLTSTEIGLIATIDERLSNLEVGLTQAQRLRDLGRQAAAEARADSVRALETELTRDITRLSEMRARQVDRSTDELRAIAQQRRSLLIMVIVFAIPKSSIVLRAL